MVRRAVGVWLLLTVAMVAQGVARHAWLRPYFGETGANQLGTITAIVLILLITLLFIKRLGARSDQALLGIGLLWLVLTVLFEFVFGRWVMGLSWSRLLADYNIFQGHFWPLVLVVVLCAPWVAAQIRGLRL